MPDDSPPADIIEIELKFTVPAGQLEGLRRAMQQGAVESLRLEAVYFDTVGDTLASRAIALRVRKEGDRWVQTAKALTSSDVWRRVEHNVPRDAAPGGGAPAFDLSLHDATPVGRAIHAALGPAGPGGGLVARFRTEVSRTTRLEHRDGAVLELALDTGQVIAGERRDAVCELEIELKSGPVQALFATADTWMLAHGLWLSTLTKAERGERLLHGVTHGEPVRAALPVVDAHAGPRRFLQSVLATCIAQVLGNASEAAAGDPHEETLHQLRVGLRRLRTALRELRGMGNAAHGIDPRWEVVFAGVFRSLGEHRDEVTLVAKLGDELLAAGFVETAAGLAVDPASEPATVVRDPAFQRAILGVMAFCQAIDADPARQRKRARRRLERELAHRLGRLHASLVRDAARFRRLPVARQHRVRKRLKRLRYLAEFAVPLFGVRRAERDRKRWRAAQDALGENNDLWVGLDRLRSVAPAEAAPASAMRWLRERQRECARRCERRLRRAFRSKGFWSR